MTSPFSCFFNPFPNFFFFSFFSPGVVYVPLAGRFMYFYQVCFWRRRDRSLFHVSVLASPVLLALRADSFTLHFKLIYFFLLRTSIITTMHPSLAILTYTQYARYLQPPTPRSVFNENRTLE